MGDLDSAITLCRMVERVAPKYGCHVALTGGCLYKDGERKDIDILFYRIRQVEAIDHEGLKAALTGIGFEDITGFGWLLKGTFSGIPVDMFFPEEMEGGNYKAQSPHEAVLDDDHLKPISTIN